MTDPNRSPRPRSASRAVSEQEAERFSPLAMALALSHIHSLLEHIRRGEIVSMHEVDEAMAMVEEISDDLFWMGS